MQVRSAGLEVGLPQSASFRVLLAAGAVSSGTLAGGSVVDFRMRSARRTLPSGQKPRSDPIYNRGCAGCHQRRNPTDPHRPFALSGTYILAEPRRDKLPQAV